MLADPDYPNKVLEGRQAEIVWCDHANSCMRRLILRSASYAVVALLTLGVAVPGGPARPDGPVVHTVTAFPASMSARASETV